MCVRLNYLQHLGSGASRFGLYEDLCGAECNIRCQWCIDLLHETLSESIFVSSTNTAALSTSLTLEMYHQFCSASNCHDMHMSWLHVMGHGMAYALACHGTFGMPCHMPWHAKANTCACHDMCHGMPWRMPWHRMGYALAWPGICHGPGAPTRAEPKRAQGGP